MSIMYMTVVIKTLKAPCVEYATSLVCKRSDRYGSRSIGLAVGAKNHHPARIPKMDVLCDSTSCSHKMRWPTPSTRAWYSYSFAAEMFSGPGLGIFMPLTLER